MYAIMSPFSALWAPSWQLLSDCASGLYDPSVISDFSVALCPSFFMCALVAPEHAGGIPASWATQLDILYSHSLLWLVVLHCPAAVTLWMGCFIQYEVRLLLPPSVAI
jgi:hypothetical protein